MRVDEAIFESVATGRSVPTIRLYAWPGAAISLGRHQEAAPLLNEERCRQDGVEVLRRPTGGKAILHQRGDITYSVIAREDAHPLSRNILASYRSVNAALAVGLAALGIRAAVRENAPVWPDTGVGFGCFESPSRQEIYWAGRKLVASAQRRRNETFLQQGAILAEHSGGDLASYLSLDPARRERLRRDLNDRTGSLVRALDAAPLLDQVIAALGDGFRREWVIELEEGPLAEHEQRILEHVSTPQIGAPAQAADFGDPSRSSIPR